MLLCHITLSVLGQPHLLYLLPFRSGKASNWATSLDMNIIIKEFRKASPTVSDIRKPLAGVASFEWLRKLLASAKANLVIVRALQDCAFAGDVIGWRVCAAVRFGLRYFVPAALPRRTFVRPSIGDAEGVCYSKQILRSEQSPSNVHAPGQEYRCTCSTAPNTNSVDRAKRVCLT